jgi:AraC-like DNA-binding protein
MTGSVKEAHGKEEQAKPLVNARLAARIKKQILQKMERKKKYLDIHYSAKKMAAEMGTNQRYLSAVLKQEFHTNYTSLVNSYRVQEAMSLLSDWQYREMSVEDISDRVGFIHRQTFYTAFTKIAGITPRQYRLNMMKDETDCQEQ